MKLKNAVIAATLALTLAATAQPPRANGMFLLAAILIWDHNSCWLNWFWGCDGDNGYGGGAPVPGDGCVSERNICGARGGGTIQADGTCSAVRPSDSLCTTCQSAPNACGLRGSGYLVDGTCDAVTPPEDQCPPEPAENGIFTVLPSRFIEVVGTPVELTWAIGSATDCTLTVNGVSQVVATSTLPGRFTTAPLMRPANDLTLSCYNAVPTNSASWTIRVMVNPKPVEF
jgi:hypothetical protein